MGWVMRMMIWEAEAKECADAGQLLRLRWWKQNIINNIVKQTTINNEGGGKASGDRRAAGGRQPEQPSAEAR